MRVHQADGYPVEGVSDPEGWLQPARELAAWTAHWNGQPVGHVSLTEASPEDDAAKMWVQRGDRSLADIAIVVRLFVDPDHRGRGVGQELMRAAYEHAAGLGKRLVFDVMLKDRQAIRLYEALGCEQLGSIVHHYGDGLEEAASVYVAPGHLPASHS